VTSAIAVFESAIPVISMITFSLKTRKKKT